MRTKPGQTSETKCAAGVFRPCYSEVSDSKYFTTALDSPAAHHKEVTVKIHVFKPTFKILLLQFKNVEEWKVQIPSSKVSEVKVQSIHHKI